MTSFHRTPYEAASFNERVRLLTRQKHFCRVYDAHWFDDTPGGPPEPISKYPDYTAVSEMLLRSGCLPRHLYPTITRNDEYPDLGRPSWAVAWFGVHGVYLEGAIGHSDDIATQGDIMVPANSPGATQAAAFARWDRQKGNISIRDVASDVNYRLNPNIAKLIHHETVVPRWINKVAIPGWEDLRRLDPHYAHGEIACGSMLPSVVKPFPFEDLYPLAEPLDLADYAVALDAALCDDHIASSITAGPILLRMLETGCIHPTSWFLRSCIWAVEQFREGYPVSHWGWNLIPTALYGFLGLNKSLPMYPNELNTPDPKRYGFFRAVEDPQFPHRLLWARDTIAFWNDSLEVPAKAIPVIARGPYGRPAWAWPRYRIPEEDLPIICARPLELIPAPKWSVPGVTP